jgi:hypothetical protein
MMDTGTAQAEVLRQLDQARARFAEAKLMYMVAGELANAEGADQFGIWLERAYRAERDDPDPRKGADPQ